MAAPRRDFLAGQLLIAMPNMADPRFERTVLLTVSHDEDHAMAVIVNKPVAEVTMGELLEKLEVGASRAVKPDHVFFGGPVHTELGLVLHSLDYRIEETLEITPGVGLTATREILVDIGGRDRLRPAPKHYMLAIGYAGWTGGQLEDELAMNAWAHCAADEHIIFAADPSRSWGKALERLGVTGAMLSPEWAAARPYDAPLN
ncbi:MAG: YqgE/AlgH family protein [Parvularculaceae bacterium]